MDALLDAGFKPANYCEIGGNPSVWKVKELTKLFLGLPRVRKMAVIMNVVSNTRVDLVARGVIKGVLESGREPREAIAAFRIPGSWEAEGQAILRHYEVAFFGRETSIDQVVDVDPMSILANTETRFWFKALRAAKPPTLHGNRFAMGRDCGRGNSGQRRPARSMACRCSTACGGIPTPSLHGQIISVPADPHSMRRIEALAGGLRLLVIVTERIPRRMWWRFSKQARVSGARVIGPNSLGIISPDRARMGMCGGARNPFGAPIPPVPWE